MTIEQMDAESKKFYYWFFGIIGVIVVLFSYFFSAYNYNPTGVQSAVIQKGVDVTVDENAFFFMVYIQDKEFRYQFPCDREPVKKKALISYRIVEVKTLTGKYKMVPSIDKSASCKSLIAT